MVIRFIHHRCPLCIHIIGWHKPPLPHQPGISLDWRSRRSHPEFLRCHSPNSNQLQSHNAHQQPSHCRNHSTQTRTARRHRTTRLRRRAPTRAATTPIRRRRPARARLRTHERSDCRRALSRGGRRRTTSDSTGALRPRRRVVQADGGLGRIQVGEGCRAARRGRQRRGHGAEDGGEGGGRRAAAERRADRADDAAVRVLLAG